MQARLHLGRYGTVVLAAAFPLFAHCATVLESSALTLASVVLLGAAILLRPMAERRLWAWVSAPLAAAVIVVLRDLDAVSALLFVPPIAVNVFLAWVFGQTLAWGSIPLIERLVRLLQPAGTPAEPAVIRYAGFLTKLWTVLFVVLAAVNLVLASITVPGGLLGSAGFTAPVTVSRETWSLFANVFNYAIVAAVFLLEYAYRRRRFPDRPYRNFADFIRRAAAAAPALSATFQTIRSASIRVPDKHPAFEGHFPGRPLLPGVVLLERVIEEAGKLGDGPLKIRELPWVKFLAPLSPGDGATVRFRREPGILHFEVFRGRERVAQGVFHVGAETRPG